MSGAGSDFTLKAVLGVNDDASGPANRIRGYFVNLKETIASTETGLKSFNTHLTQLKQGAQLLAVSAAAGMLTRSLIQARLETGLLESEIRTLDVGDTGINAVNQAGDRMGRMYGTLRTEFLRGSYDIRSGISSLREDQVGAFTEIVAATARGTRGSVAQMSSYFGSVYNIFRSNYRNMSDLDFGRLIGNYTAYAVRVFKTDGPKMQQAMENVGATAASMGVELHEQMGVLGALSNMMGGGEAGTRFRALLTGVAEAGRKLGMSHEFTDAQGHMRSVVDVLDAIRRRFPDIRSSAAQIRLKEAFGSDEAVQAIMALTPQLDQLRTGIRDVRASSASGVMDDMARLASDNSATNIQRISYGWNRLKETLAVGFEGPLNAIIGGVREVLFVFVEFLNTHPRLRSFVGTLIPTIAIVTGIAGAIKVASGAMGLYTLVTKAAAAAAVAQGAASVGGAASTGLHAAGAAAATTVMSGLTFSLAGAASSAWAFTTALLANPITWIVVGVVALGVGLYMLVKHWDTVKQAGVNAWNWLRNTWNDAPQWFKGIVALIIWPFSLLIAGGRLLIKHWDDLKGFASRTASGMYNAWNSTPEWVKAVVNPFIWMGEKLYYLASNWDVIKNKGIKFWNDIRGAWNDAPQWVRDIVNGITAPFVGPIRAIIYVADAIVSHWDKVREIFNGLLEDLAPVINWAKSVLGSIGTAVFGEASMNVAGQNAGRALVRGVAQGATSQQGFLRSALTSTLSVWDRLRPHSDAHEGPLSTLSSSGRALVRTFGAGVEHEGGRNRAVADYLQMQSRSISPSSPVLQQITENSTRRMNVTADRLVGVNISGQGQRLTIDDIVRMVNQAVHSELTRLEGAV